MAEQDLMAGGQQPPEQPPTDQPPVDQPEQPSAPEQPTQPEQPQAQDQVDLEAFSTQFLDQAGDQRATPDFSAFFQQTYGRAPTQEELNQFTQFRSAYGQPQDTPTVQETTTTTNPDGSQTTQTEDYTTPEAQEYKKQLDDAAQSIDTEIEYARSKYRAIAENADDAQANLLRAIEAAFDVRRAEMERINKAALNTQALLGARSGRQRYAPEMQSSILSEEERAGLIRLTEIDALEFQTIAAAQQAAVEQNLAILNNEMATLAGLREEKNSLITQMYNLAVQEEARAQQKAKFTLDMQQYENEIVRYEMENQMIYADAAAASLVEFDEYFNFVMPSQAEIQQKANEIGIDPNVLSRAVFNQMQVVSKMGADEYGTYFENQQFAAQQAQRNFDNFLAQQKFALEQQMFGLDAISDGFVFDDMGNLINIGTNEPAGAENWAQLIKKGIYKPSDVPSELKQAVANELANMPPDKKELDTLQSKISEIEALFNHPGFNDAVGPNALVRSANTALGGFLRGGFIGMSNVNKANSFVGKVNSLLSQEVLQKLIDSKASGATFGALSEGELAILQVAASELNQYGEDINGDGRVDYYNIDEKTFKNALQDILDDYKKLYDEGKSMFNEVTPFSGFQDFSLRGDSYAKSLYNQYDNDPDLSELTPDEIVDLVNEDLGFNQPLSMGVKGTAVSNIKDYSRVKTSVGSGIATAIQKGSPKWQYGFDIVLDGGKGAPVKVPFSGTVVEAKKAGGFGNSVVVQLADGRKIRASHLDSINVQPGQKVTPNTILGGQGNTGTVMGQTGIHVDYTMYKPDGGYYSSQEVASFFNTKLA